MDLSPLGGTSSALRDANLQRLRGGTFDALVVGAGINGAVAGGALAAAGASVALVDANDFGSFTSQESSNLVWGGIKYLENGEVRLVRKLCLARNELLRAFPDSVSEIRFLVPLDSRPLGFRRSLPVLWAGTWLYWLFGSCFTRRPRLVTRARLAAEEPVVDTGDLRGGVEYSDAYLRDNDTRFVFGFVRAALNHGAATANYVGIQSCSRGSDGLWRARAVERLTGEEFDIRARVLVNAAGPYVDDLNRESGVETDARHVFSKGIHLIVDRVTPHEHVLTFFDVTGRMYFVIPMGNRSVIGTTDTRVERPEATVTDEDRRFLFENVNARLRLERPLGPSDVVSERCGVRPLVVEGGGDDASAEWLQLSRKHVIDVDEERRCLSIFGGKLTDCLNVGAEVVEAVEGFGLPVQRQPGRWYGEPPRAVRDEFYREALRTGLDRQAGDSLYERPSTRLWRRYGTKAFAMLEDVGRDPSLCDPVIQGAQYRRCELEFAARAEMVVRLEDFLRRRSKLALVRRREDLAQSAGMLEAAEILFGPDAQARLDEYFG